MREIGFVWQGFFGPLRGFFCPPWAVAGGLWLGLAVLRIAVVSSRFGRVRELSPISRRSRAPISRRSRPISPPDLAPGTGAQDNGVVNPAVPLAEVRAVRFSREDSLFGGCHRSPLTDLPSVTDLPSLFGGCHRSPLPSPISPPPDLPTDLPLGHLRFLAWLVY